MRHVARDEARPTRRVDRAGLAIQALAEAGPPTPEAIDAFIEEHSFPIVEGSRCTFVYRGEAKDVRLRHWIFGLPTDERFERIAGSDVWFHVIELPEGSRLEYKLEVTVGRATRLIQDPLNPLVAHDPFGGNSVCQAAGYEVPDWTFDLPEVPKGSLEDRVFWSDALGEQRRITLYRPARFMETRRYPLLIVHDGGDYLRFASFQTVLDNLIHRLEVAGVIAVLTHPPDRMTQYRDDAGHAAYLAEELVPTLEAELPLTGTPTGRALMGASLGAVASLSTAMRYPDVFGRLLLQSGSFAFSDIGDHDRGPVFDPIADMVNRYRAAPTPVAERVFVSCGMYESLIYENRSLVPLLEKTGMSVRYVESRDGHNWEAWRDRLRGGLSFLFPGPMWWVYE
jgi:enterochelin esterase family protein